MAPANQDSGQLAPSDLSAYGASVPPIIYVLVILIASAGAHAQPAVLSEPPHKEYAQDFHPAIKSDGKEVADLSIYGHEASDSVKFEPTGLHITLAAGYPKQRPGTGVVTDFGVKGDFEITVSYEILSEAQPASWANFRIAVVPDEPVVADVWHKAGQNRAVLVREVVFAKGAGRFFANQTSWHPDLPVDKFGNEIFSNVERQAKAMRVLTNTARGRMRLVRSGAELYFLVSEGGDTEFKVLQKSEFGVKDLKNVRILATTGTVGDSLEALVTDFQVRADAFVKRTPPPPPLVAPQTTPQPSLLIPVAIGSAVALVVLFVVGAVAWSLLRGRRAETPAKPAPIRESLTFACSHCGKKIRAKPERAGKNVKCPQCSQVTRVPAAKEAS
jgi:hypothetical protein